MKKSTLTFALLILSTVLWSQDIYLHCGKVIDVESGKVQSQKTIVVSGTKIKAIASGYLTPEGENDKVIDLKEKVVMPGLIDMHVHLEFEVNPKRYIERFTANEVDVAYDALNYGKKTLMAGFTTVRDMGGSGVIIGLRNAINNNKVKGPRIYAAEKALGTTGGHADPTNGYSSALVGNPGPKEGVVNGVDDARKAVRQRYKNGADVIKITATGGVLSVAKNGQNPQFTLEEIQAITSTATDYEMHVAAHAHGDEGMYRAVAGGVKTIEHGTLMSEKTMELMIEKDAYLVPTITAGAEVTEKAAVKGYYPDIIVPKALAIGPKIQDTFGRAYKKGVGIAFGTDAGVFPHGQNGREFGYMTDAGMPIMEAIQSATITAAKILKWDDRLGTLSIGKLADIIAVDEDPQKDVSTMERVSFVMKDGKVYKK